MDNLRKRARQARASGQIATFLLLMIMAALVFALMTANLGHLALKATTTANAADQSALLLASQLSTKGHQLYESLGNRYEKCKRGGFLSIILAIVIAIVLIVLAIFTFGAGTIATAAFLGMTGKTAIIAAGAIGGAIGGATGGAIAGTGAAQGALQGAMVGAAIGMGVASFGTQTAVGSQSIGAGATTPGGAGAVTTQTTLYTGAGAVPGAAPMSGAWVVGAGTALPAGAQIISGAAIVGSNTAAIIGGSLAVGSSLYSAVVQDQASAAVLDAALKALNKFPERMRMEQGVIFDALSRTVDDAERVTDEHDLNGNGLTTDKIPRFLKLWDDRLNGKDLKDKLKQLTNRTAAFVNGPLAEFRNAAEAAYTCRPGWVGYGYQWGGRYWSNCATRGFLARAAIEGEPSGVLEQVASSLHRIGRDLSFWKEGPSSEALKPWADSEDPNLPPPPGTDETDMLIADVQDIVQIVDGLRAQDMESLMASWRGWIGWFYDPDLEQPSADSTPAEAGAVDYYTTLGWQVDGNAAERIKGMKAWDVEIEQRKQGLPTCELGIWQGWGWQGGGYGVCQPMYYGGYYGRQADCVRNPPCQGTVRKNYWSPPTTFWTADQDLDDEFAELHGELAADSAAAAAKKLIPEIVKFREAVKEFYTDMKRREEQMLNTPSTTPGGLVGFIGNNPVVYRWQDTRGNHAVEVEVGPFRIPWLRKKKSGGFLMKKVCIILTDHSDDGRRTWVRIAEHHPTSQAMGVWTWNPFEGTTEKVGRAAFTISGVRLAGTTKPVKIGHGAGP